MFDEIWDLLGLPNLVALFTLDVGALIENAIASLRKRDELVEKIQNAVGEAREKLEEELGRINAQILGVIEDISIFGFNIRKIIGGIIEDESVLSLEEQIMEFKLALEDFKQNWQKKLLFEWVKIVKKFLMQSV